jgi:hypothetical protein
MRMSDLKAHHSISERKTEYFNEEEKFCELDNPILSVQSKMNYTGATERYPIHGEDDGPRDFLLTV